MTQAGERGPVTRTITRILAVFADLYVINWAISSAGNLGFLGPDPRHTPLTVPIMVIMMTVFYLAGLYEMDAQIRLRELVWRLLWR